MTDTTPIAPADLDVRGKQFWQQTVSTYNLSGTELELLIEACRLLDECEQLRRTIDVGGLTVAGAAGQPRVHPALGELRQHRLALAKLLAQLELPDEQGAVLSTALQARGRRAASSRWGPVNEAKAAARAALGGSA